MWFKHPAWRPVAWILSVANIAAVWFAAAPGEPWHASAHAVLAVLFGLGAQRLGQRHRLAAGADTTEETIRELEDRVADLDRVQGMDSRVPQLEERLDFLERALIDVRNRAQVPPRE